MAVLVPVAFAPDWVEWICAEFGRRDPILSHSLVSIGIGATLVALVYGIVARDAHGGGLVWLTYASHWPADFITGRKPTWPGGPSVGLLLYTHPKADVLLESVVVVVCWAIYVRSLPPVRRRLLPLLLPAGLIAMQVVFAALQVDRIKDPLHRAVDTLFP